jgi:putative nucleotidyltransferase with HDIG domain
MKSLHDITGQKKPKVLIADDNSDDRRVLKYNLLMHECDVVEARDGEEGLELAKRHKPDVIISDGLMPRVDGFQFLKNIKMNEALKSIPFIFYSAVYVGSKEEELSFSLGAEAFIFKPKDPAELWEELCSILIKHRAKLETEQAKPLVQEEDYLKKYSHIVVAKLEEKVSELTEEIAERKRTEEKLRRSEENYRKAAQENEMLYRNLEQLMVSTITSLAAAIDAKSHWTRGHSERVTKYATAIAANMGLEGKELENVRLSGLLHDIGKIGTHEAVLDKTGRLVENEIGEVRMHPVIGAEILSPIQELRDVIPGILQHHERFDGTGYPDGIRGEDIHLYARILGVADAFDAMTENRPYRSSIGREFAISELRRGSGTQFDPRVVEAFLKVVVEEAEPAAFYERGGKGEGERKP